MGFIDTSTYAGFAADGDLHGSDIRLVHAKADDCRQIKWQAIYSGPEDQVNVKYKRFDLIRQVYCDIYIISQEQQNGIQEDKTT